MPDQPSKESLERAIRFHRHVAIDDGDACLDCIRLALEFDAITKEGESKLSIGVELWTKACRKAEDDIKALRQQNAALVSALREVPDPEEEGVCPAGCGRMDLTEERITDGKNSYKRYFFKHTKCWYAKLQVALTSYAPAEE